MKNLLESAIAEHTSLLKEADAEGTCWSSYENSSIVQLFHQVSVKLEKEEWTCDFSQEPFMRIPGRQYKVKKAEFSMEMQECKTTIWPKKGKVLNYVNLTGTLANLFVVFEDNHGRLLTMPSYLFVEETFEMMQRGNNGK